MDGKKYWFLGPKVWLRVGKVLGTLQRLSNDSPLFWQNLNFQKLVVKHGFGIGFQGFACIGALRLGFWMGVVPIYAFLRHSAKYQISTAKIRRHVTLLSRWKLDIALL